MNKYNNDVMVIAYNRTIVDQCDVLTKEMCQMIITMTNFKYVFEHCDMSKGTVWKDEINKLKNDISIVSSDLDIFMSMANITEDVGIKKEKRIEKMAKKIKEVD